MGTMELVTYLDLPDNPTSILHTRDGPSKKKTQSGDGREKSEGIRRRTITRGHPIGKQMRSASKRNPLASQSPSMKNKVKDK